MKRMHPYAAVQSMLDDSREGLLKIVGSCFRITADKFFLTAAHVVSSINVSDLRVMNLFDEDHDLACQTVD